MGFFDWTKENLSVITAPPHGEATAVEVVDESKLGTLSAWAAGGFTLLSAVLLFFQLKDGLLDQAIRLYPYSTIAVFVLLGAGVLASLLVSALTPGSRIQLWIVVSAASAMLASAAAAFPNLRPDDDASATATPIDDVINLGWAHAIIKLAPVILGIAFVPLLLGLLYAMSQRRHWYVLLGLLVLVIATGICAYVGLRRFLPDSPEQYSVLALTVVVIAAILFATDKRVSLTVAVVALGVAATAAALYGATKVSVQSKVLTVPPRVDASFSTQDGVDGIKVTVSASKLRKESVLVVISGLPKLGEPNFRPYATGTTNPEIFRKSFVPDALDQVSADTFVPITPAQWEFVAVDYCTPAIGASDCDRPLMLGVQLRSSQAELRSAVSAQITKSTSGLEIKMVGAHLSPGASVGVVVARVGTGAPETQLASATIIADATGNSSADLVVADGEPGSHTDVRYKICMDADCSGRLIPVASYSSA